MALQKKSTVKRYLGTPCVHIIIYRLLPLSPPLFSLLFLPSTRYKTKGVSRSNTEEAGQVAVAVALAAAAAAFTSIRYHALQAPVFQATATTNTELAPPPLPTVITSPRV